MENPTPPLVMDPSGNNIQGESARIRDRGPITQVELPSGILAWAVTDQEILRKLLLDSRVSKDARQHWPTFISGDVGPDWPLYAWVAVNNMLTAYGADHTRLRKLVQPAFSARRTKAMRPRVQALADDLLDRLAQTPPGQPTDLRENYCYLVPIGVITELMGVPEHLHAVLRTCVDGIFDTALTSEQAAANFAEMQRILRELVTYRRATPGEDMTSMLITHRDEDDGSTLTEQELVDTLLLVISAGHETTVNLLDQAIFLLLTQPEQKAKLDAGTVTWSEVVEEALRLEAPVAHLPLRFAVEDIDIDIDTGDGPTGIRIARGDAILASYAAAGRDPKVHGPTADDFDVSREIKAHLSFGWGAHLCLGAALARLEAEIALSALFERFPSMRLAKDPADLGSISSFISNGHDALPVHLGT